MRVVKGIAHKMYDYGDLRDEWLRGPSRAFVDDVLLSPRLGDRGVADPDGVRRLVAEHMNGHDHTLAISILLQIELWHRCFIDGERPWPEPGA